MNFSSDPIQSGTVLVVENSLSTLMLLTKWLEMRGYDVVSARTGQDALQVARQQHPNIILISVYLPDQDGDSVCQKLQQQPQTACIPVILLGVIDISEHERLLTTDGYDSIAQPFQPNDILALVNYHVQRRALQQQENQHLQQENQHLQQENQHLQQENQHLQQENQHLQQENQHLQQENQHLQQENQHLQQKAEDSDRPKPHKPPQDFSHSSNSLRGEQGQQRANAALNNYIDYVLLLQQITDAIRVHLHPQDIFETAVAHVGRAFGVNRCVLLTYEPEQLHYLPVVAIFQDSGSFAFDHWIICSHDNEYLETVLAQDQAVTCSKDQANIAFYHYGMDCNAMDGIDHNSMNDSTAVDRSMPPRCPHDIQSMISVRISYQGQPNGVIMLQQCNRPHQWTEQDKFQLTAIAGHIGIALAQSRLLENEKHQRSILDAQNLQLQEEIHQRKETENALKQAKETAETANCAKSEFLANMSHELRTPLNAILGFTQVLEQMDNLSPDQQDYLGIISRCGHHLLALINDVLEMSKIEAGQVELYETSFDLGQLLHTILDIVQLKADEKGITLSFICPDAYPRQVVADENKLRQILLNLLDNAIKFTSHGYVRLHLVIEPSTTVMSGVLEQAPSLSYQEEFRLRFEVEDTGPGIAEHELDLLFQSFAQTDAGKKHGGGTGLGLAITQKFVALMGGKLIVESDVGVGTTFQFTIPVRGSDRSTSGTTESIDKLAPGQSDYRILIAEDNTINQKLLVRILEDVGFQTQVVDNGEDVIQYLEKWNPHLIFMDILMPKMDGLRATRLLRSLPGSQTIPILALTAYVFEETRQEALQAGFNDVLSKPIQRDYLLGKIADYLDLKYLYHSGGKTDNGQDAIDPLLERFSPLSLKKSPNRESDDEFSSLVGHLKKMPDVWTQELRQAATLGLDQRLLNLVKDIPPSSRVLADSLIQWSHDFRFDNVIELTNRAI